VAVLRPLLLLEVPRTVVLLLLVHRRRVVLLVDLLQVVGLLDLVLSRGVTLRRRQAGMAEKLLDDGRADEACGTCHEDMHGGFSYPDRVND